MAGAFDAASDQGAFQGDVPVFPGPFPNLYSDADWQSAMQRYKNMRQAGFPQSGWLGAPWQSIASTASGLPWSGVDLVSFGTLAPFGEPASEATQAALGCNDAFMRCYNLNSNDSAWKNQCAASLQACLTHGLPTIFPGRIWGQG